jgi:hypothetical protein
VLKIEIDAKLRPGTLEQAESFGTTSLLMPSPGMTAIL